MTTTAVTDNDNNNNNDNNNSKAIISQELLDSIMTFSTIWLAGKRKEYPTTHILPIELAKRYRLDKPCRIILQGMPKEGGILIKFFSENNHLNSRNKIKMIKSNNNNNNNNDK